MMKDKLKGMALGSSTMPLLNKSDFEKNINTWCWRCYGISVRGVLDKK